MNLNQYPQVYHEGGQSWEIVCKHPTRVFTNKDGNLNSEVIGKYVKHIGGSKVKGYNSYLVFLKDIESVDYTEVKNEKL